MNDFLKEELCAQIDDAKIKLVNAIHDKDQDAVSRYESVISDLESQLKALN